MSSDRAARIGFCWCALWTMAACLPARAAAPWIEPQDSALRSDVEVLAAHRLIDGLTTTWPLPRGQLLRYLHDDARLRTQPPEVQAAARRVLLALGGDGEAPGLRPTAGLRVASAPDALRSFDARAREQVDAAAGLVLEHSPDTQLRLRVGEQTRFDGNHARFALDGTEGIARLGNLDFYAGWVDQWYGPGWQSSLILSTNARPFPKIGFLRDDPHAFETPWLSWIGPWQANFFVGLLDGERVDRNTVVGSLRLSLAPVRGLEIALTRVTEFCGAHHPCDPFNAAFHFGNSDGNQNEVNEEATIELKYSGRLGPVMVSPYAQFMNEDTGPFTHSYTSYLGGLSFAGPWGEDGAHWRLTAEVGDSVSTLNWFDFGKKSTGLAYNNAGYVDGFRYRDRTLGFSLDSDSRLYSLLAEINLPNGWTPRLAFHRAEIGTAALDALRARDPAGPFRNALSDGAVRFDQLEAALSVPLRRVLRLDFALRAQDRQPLAEHGGRVAAEIGLRYGF